MLAIVRVIVTVLTFAVSAPLLQKNGGYEVAPSFLRSKGAKYFNVNVSCQFKYESSILQRRTVLAFVTNGIPVWEIRGWPRQGVIRERE